MKTSFAFPSVSLALTTRESRKTTYPAFKPGMLAYCGAAYRAQLKLSFRLENFRSDTAQNWFLAKVLSKTRTSSRSK